jgi:ATP-dependent Lon protease
MEVVRISGYSTFEKEHIARQFLIPKQMEESGLSERHLTFTDEGLEQIIQRYTQEAGVREMERQIAKVCRKVARVVVSAAKRAKLKTTVLTTDSVLDLLGPPTYSDIYAVDKAHVGVSIGLAWTVAGGDILSIETTLMRGKGNLMLTGQLGEVMQESAQAAYTYLRSEAKALKIRMEFWKNYDVHVHVPEGAIPKDGPSAGVAMVISMLSALKGKAPKPKIAMTGEMTLRGWVLDVGGVKEKVLAAHRAGVTTILLPKGVKKDLVEVPEEVKKDLKFTFIETVEQAIAAAFPKTRARR